MKLQFTPPPGAIAFHINSSGAEVMRIARDGVWANPDIPADEAAKLVLGALDRYIKELVKRVVEDEREACAKTCEARSLRDDDMGAILARAIRARGEE